MNNLFASSPSPKEQVEVLHQTAHTRVERIVSYGQTSGWYDQEEEEWVCVLQGEGELAFVDHTLTLKAGDTLLIPRHQRHRVIYTSSPCIWLCIFFNEKGD